VVGILAIEDIGPPTADGTAEQLRVRVDGQPPTLARSLRTRRSNRHSL
jgi:hypothetical protein